MIIFLMQGLSDEEEAEIEKVIREHNHQFINYHKLKTRKSGNMKHIDFHITVAPNLTVEETHDIIGLIVILYTPLSVFLKLAPLSLNQLIIAVVIAIAQLVGMNL